MDWDNADKNYLMEIITNLKESRSLYFIRFLCFIPLIGAFFGLWLLLKGLFHYKDKWLSITGIAGILWTFIVYLAILNIDKYDLSIKKQSEYLSQTQLNNLVQSVEHYRLAHGQYPDSLKQLWDDDQSTQIFDAAQGMNAKGLMYYNYKKIGDTYLLFSSGQDGIPNTKDDLFPQVYVNQQTGLIKKSFIKLHPPKFTHTTQRS